ncbi:MAG: hypothetical protein LBU50_06560 [Cellulomonas sp.]|nr:hypothetical protein [Cellulomonas sp.]
MELGGDGLNIPDFIDFAVEASAADPNVTQSWRTHILSVERYLKQQPGPDRDFWLKEIASGKVIGGAWTDVGTDPIGRFTTVVSRQDGRWVLNGKKFYSTGNLFADWLQIGAVTEEGRLVIAIVRSGTLGIEEFDDWDGFGQQLTASGTTILTDVPVDEGNVVGFEDSHDGSRGWQQLVLLAVFVGIGVAIEREAVALVQGHPETSRDSAPLYGEILGKISARIFGAQAALRIASERTQAAHDAIVDSHLDKPALVEASELAIFKTQVVAIDAVLEAANLAFQLTDHPFSPSTDHSLRTIERLWRNARTIACHNPELFKQRMVADAVAFGIDPGAARADRDRSAARRP